MGWKWALAALLLAGCASGAKPGGAAVEAVPPLRVAAPGPEQAAAPSQMVPEAAPEAAPQELRGHLADIFFDTAQAGIRPNQREVLVANAVLLRRHAEWRLVLEGHCDERGTAAYNLALGQRRAEAVRLALMALGVEARRLGVVSHGEERPQCGEAAEGCWRKNRRVRIRVEGTE